MAKWKISYFIYNILVLFAAIFIAPYFIMRNLLLRRPVLRYFNNFSQSEVEELKGKKVIWIQAVSVGETMVAASLIREIKEVLPEYKVVFTTTTPAGFLIATQKLEDMALITFFPLEIPILMRRFVKKIHPEILILVESELWPNAVRYAKGFGAKVALANGRISDRSYKNYLRFSGFIKNIFQQIDLFIMQSVEDANRIGEIGAPLERIMVSGNVKFDQDYPVYSDEQLNLFRQQYRLKPGMLILTAGSTHRGEEEIIIEAFQNLRLETPCFLILAPRHSERADEVAALLNENKLSFCKRSSGKTKVNSQVLLLDTYGELSLVYAVADLVFVGGSLIKMNGIAGHNILEAAAQGKPVIYGPYMDNFRESKGLLEEVDAGFTVHNAKELTLKLKELLADPVLYQNRASNAKNAVLTNRGAAGNSIELLKKLVDNKES